MPHTDALYHWTARVQTLFPALTPGHATALAWYSFGLVLARGCGLSTGVTHLAGLRGRSAHTLRQRRRALYQPGAVPRGAAREADWPPRGWQPDPLTEEQMDQC
jgi:hypothetical protein